MANILARSPSNYFVPANTFVGHDSMVVDIITAFEEKKQDRIWMR
jgi:hypothetical protein